jgi:hypothetical protein
MWLGDQYVGPAALLQEGTAQYSFYKTLSGPQDQLFFLLQAWTGPLGSRRVRLQNF